MFYYLFASSYSYWRFYENGYNIFYKLNYFLYMSCCLVNKLAVIARNKVPIIIPRQKVIVITHYFSPYVPKTPY